VCKSLRCSFQLGLPLWRFHFLDGIFPGRWYPKGLTAKRMVFKRFSPKLSPYSVGGQNRRGGQPFHFETILPVGTDVLEFCKPNREVLLQRPQLELPLPYHHRNRANLSKCAIALGGLASCSLKNSESTQTRKKHWVGGLAHLGIFPDHLPTVSACLAKTERGEPSHPYRL